MIKNKNTLILLILLIKIKYIIFEDLDRNSDNEKWNFKKFKEIAKIAKKNPDKQYVVAFNEIDSLINNVNKLGSNNMHLGQNRTSFLNGLDSIKDIHNLTIVGTTNINPKTANLDAATLSRLGNIFEIEKPISKEIKSALKFHLNKSEAAKDLIKKNCRHDICKKWSTKRC